MFSHRGGSGPEDAAELKVSAIVWLCTAQPVLLG